MQIVIKFLILTLIIFNSENELAEMLTCKLTKQNIGLWGITSIESKNVGKTSKKRRGKRRSGGKESDKQVSIYYLYTKKKSSLVTFFNLITNN